MEKKLETKISYVNSEEDNNIQFLIELYHIMYKFDIHKIHRISNDGKKIIDAHQSLKTNIGNNHITYMIFDTIKEKLPYIYFNIFFKVHLYKYRKRLKNVCDKFHIKSIRALSYSLYQGIYISNNRLCISGVEIAYDDGRLHTIDKLYLDI